MLSSRHAKKPIVWIVKQYAVTPDLPGNTRHFELGRRLAKRGYGVTILASSFHYSQRRQFRAAGRRPWSVEEVDGVRFVWIRTPAFARNDWRRVFHMLVFLFRTWRVRRGLTRRGPRLTAPDIVMGCTVPPTAALAGYLFARRFRCPYLYEIGDVWPQVLIEAETVSKQHPLAMALSWLDGFFIRRAALITTPLPLRGATRPGTGR